MALFASGDGLQIAGGAGVDAQRHLERFALKRVGVGDQQVLEDTALERAEHRAKQVGVQARQLFQYGVGSAGGFGHARGSIRRSGRGCRVAGALALAATAGTAGPGSGGINRCGSGRGGRRIGRHGRGNQAAGRLQQRTEKTTPHHPRFHCRAVSGAVSELYPARRTLRNRAIQTDVFFV